MKGSNIDINKLFLEHSKDFINCDLVLYVVGRCDAGSSFVGVANIC